MRPDAAHAFDRADWSPDDAAEALRAHGCRVTAPRVAVLRALLETEGTLDAPTLARRAAEHQPGIHEATVYRTVATLSEVGIASHVHAGHGPSLVRLSGDDQLVVVCRDCGAIEAVPADHVDRLVEGVRRSTGFEVEPGHFALEGICADCGAS